MTKEDFKIYLIQELLKSTGGYPDDKQRLEIQKLTDFVFNEE